MKTYLQMNVHMERGRGRGHALAQSPKCVGRQREKTIGKTRWKIGFFFFVVIIEAVIHIARIPLDLETD